jgi:hypothetical protein
MSNKTRRYQYGLSGLRPSQIYLDKEGHRAQEAGYRDYLKNQDLAERIQQARENRYGGGESYEFPKRPLTLFGRVLLCLIGLALGKGALFFAELLLTEIVSPQGQLILSNLFYPGSLACVIAASVLGYATYRVLRFALSPGSTEN